MAGYLKLMLALIFLGVSCKSFAFHIDGEAKNGTEDQYEIFKKEKAENDRKIKAEMAKQIAAELSREKEAKMDKMDSEDETKINRDIESVFARENMADAKKQIQSDFARYIETEIATKEEAKLEKRSQCQNEIVHFETAADNLYYRFPFDSSQRVLGDGFIIFAVRACRDAFVRLSAEWNPPTEDIRILLGYNLNRESRIKFNGRETWYTGSGTYAIHNPLGCSNIRFFWARWSHSGQDIFNPKPTSTTITVGKGAAVGEDEFMSYTGNDYVEISYVSVSTGTGATGKWIFLDHSAL